MNRQTTVEKTSIFTYKYMRIQFISGQFFNHLLVPEINLIIEGWESYENSKPATFSYLSKRAD